MNLPSEFFPPGFGGTHENILAELRDTRHIESAIQEPDDYRAAYVRGFGRAVALLRRLPAVLEAFGPLEIARLHAALYTGLYRSAGLWREPGDFVIFGGRLGADAQCVEPELALLQQQAGKLINQWSPTSDPEAAVIERLALIAFFHARFVVIHPFHDGNGRVARLIAQWQEWCLFGPLPPRLPVPRVLYDQALQALPTDLGPMMNYYCQRHSERLFFGGSRTPPFPVKMTLPVPGW